MDAREGKGVMPAIRQRQLGLTAEADLDRAGMGPYGYTEEFPNVRNETTPNQQEQTPWSSMLCSDSTGRRAQEGLTAWVS